MEPWDGPTAISFTDGKQIGAILTGTVSVRPVIMSQKMIILFSHLK